MKTKETMNTSQFAIVRGYNDSDNFATKTFIPCSIVYTSYSKKCIDYEINKLKNEQKFRSKKERYIFKIVKASKYQTYLDIYNFNQWKSGILYDIDYHFSGIGNKYLEALKSGISGIIFESVNINDIINLGVADIKYTTSADESISARFRTSTWVFTVDGSIGDYKFCGNAYDVSGL